MDDGKDDVMDGEDEKPKWLRAIQDSHGRTLKIGHASGNFEYVIRDVERLIELYDKSVDRRSPHSYREFGGLKRACVILTVTTWETYVQDLVRECFQVRLDLSDAPSVLMSAFNRAAHRWLDSNPKPPDLAQWTGAGWKAKLMDRCNLDLATLNNPSSQNVQKLFERYLGIDIIQAWHWPGTSPETAARRLDELIKLRGQLAHRARDVYKERANISRSTAVSAVNLIKRLVDSTDRALGIWMTPIMPGEPY